MVEVTGQAQGVGVVAPTSTEPRPRLLCVDDEPAILAGLALHLRRRYVVENATSGAAALELLANSPPFAAVISDMRMPGMDGATFLTHARQRAPDCVRILLTGHAEVNAAIAAVNEGQIFRFLTKPCPPMVLLSTVSAAIEQNRLVTAEKVLLEQTLRGSIKALTDVLSLTNPACFGRANRVQHHVRDIARRLEIEDAWQVEMAAMLSQLGGIILPQETVEKLHRSEALTESETAMVARVPAVTEQILGNIPRLESVRAMIAMQGRPFGELGSCASDGVKARAVRGAQLLTIAADFDALELKGLGADKSLDTLLLRGDRYDQVVVGALAAERRSVGRTVEIRELTVSQMRVGMVLAEDVKLQSGTLVVTHGFVVTSSFLERLLNFSSAVKQPIRVMIQDP